MNCLLKVSILFLYILFLFILFFLILFTLFIHNVQFLGDLIRKISKLKSCGTFCCGVASGSFSGCCSWRCSGGPWILSACSSGGRGSSRIVRFCWTHGSPSNGADSRIVLFSVDKQKYVQFCKFKLGHLDHILMLQIQESYWFLWTNRNMCNSANLSWAIRVGTKDKKNKPSVWVSWQFWGTGTESSTSGCTSPCCWTSGCCCCSSISSCLTTTY